MSDTRTTTETAHHHSTDIDTHRRVEVFDTNPAHGNHNQEATLGRDGSTTAESHNLADPGFGHADLHKAEVIRGDSGAADFRSTALRDSALNSTDVNSANPQGTHWGTVLMMVALILLIILIGSWLF